MAKFSDYEDDVLKEIEKEHEKRGFLAFMTIIFRKFLPLININYLNPYVDLTGCTAGTYQLPLQLELPSKAIWEEEKMLDVKITGQAQ